MEAKDTVMSIEQIARFDHRRTTWLSDGGHFEGVCDLKGLAQEQAEISFKAGYKEAIQANEYLNEDVLSASRQEGRREVVEYADELCPHGTLSADTSRAYRRECEICWQAKRKEQEGIK